MRTFSRHRTEQTSPATDTTYKLEYNLFLFRTLHTCEMHMIHFDNRDRPLLLVLLGGLHWLLFSITAMLQHYFEV